jgi:PAS domain S-box-containing protein
MPEKESIEELRQRISRLEETLERRTWELTNEISAYVVLQDELMKQSKSLNLRIREQSCILQLSRLGQRIELSMESFIQESLPIIQASFASPEFTGVEVSYKGTSYYTPNLNRVSGDVASVEINYGGKSYHSPNFLLTPKKITRGLMQNNKMLGSVNVFLTGDEVDDKTNRGFSSEEKGLLITIANYIMQIIRQKEHEEQLQNFQEVITHSNNIISISSLTGETEYVNEAYTKTLGHTLEEVHRPGFVHESLKSSGNPTYKAVRDAIEKNGIWKGEIMVPSKAGESVWLRGTVSVIGKEQGKYKIVSIYENITDEIQLRQQLKEQFERNQLVLENIPVAITLTDRDGRFFYINRQTVINLGMKEDQILGKTITDIFPEEGRQTLKTIQQIFRTRQPVFSETSYMINNRLRHFDINRVPLPGKDGEVSAVMSIAMETTEMRHAQGILKVQYSIDSLHSLSGPFQGALNILFDNLFQLDWVDSGGIYVFNDDKSLLELIYHRGLSETFISNALSYKSDTDEVKLVNDRIPMFLEFQDFEMLSVKHLEAEGIRFLSVLPLVYQDEVIGALNLASRSVRQLSEYDRLATEAIAAKVANLMVLIRTSDALQRSNENLRQKIGEAEEKQRMLEQKSKMELLGEMAAGLAHEINQPLSIISLTVENILYKMMEKYIVSDFFIKKFENINQNINKIRELIDHIRAFSRDQSSVFFDRVDVNTTVSSVVSMMETQLTNHQIRLELDLCEGSPCTFGNATKLEQVIMNLMTNARDAVEQKHREATGGKYIMQIKVRSYQENDRIIVEVEDNGIGIREEHKPSIFLPFFTTKLVGQGTGLGLAIIFGIVTEMKGTIGFESEWGKYTRMKLSLMKI